MPVHTCYRGSLAHAWLHCHPTWRTLTFFSFSVKAEKGLAYQLSKAVDGTNYQLLIFFSLKVTLCLNFVPASVKNNEVLGFVIAILDQWRRRIRSPRHFRMVINELQRLIFWLKTTVWIIFRTTDKSYLLICLSSMSFTLLLILKALKKVHSAFSSRSFSYNFQRYQMR